ncbi:hypothetical protein [Sinosporangium siamense]|uniref:Uncharacterized protein n=1 Tax=Sinosporangium siamense TaxID=1367973 RepID=A0A919RB91_9ACTN|nr:hypothetical protein [Sinosporangium siamense]GII90457.1 hypothetical protein Ssi02_06880 [Sinosporangium siamense]
MAIEWPREEVLAAVRTHLLRAGGVTDGYSAVDVVAEPENMLVIFRWRRDPNVFAIEIGFPATPESTVTGEPLPSADAWASDVEFRLMEELDTGLIHRGHRTIRDGYVVLDPKDAPDIWPTGYFIDSVPLGDDVMLTPPPLSAIACWLAEAGMDVTIPRRLIAEARPSGFRHMSTTPVGNRLSVMRPRPGRTSSTPPPV